jgi:hypothetical protein
MVHSPENGLQVLGIRVEAVVAQKFDQVLQVYCLFIIGNLSKCLGFDEILSQQQLFLYLFSLLQVPHFSGNVSTNIIHDLMVDSSMVLEAAIVPSAHAYRSKCLIGSWQKELAKFIEIKTSISISIVLLY